MDTENQTLRFLKNTLDHWVKEGDHGRVQHTVDLIKKEMTAMELKMAKDAQRGENALRAKDIEDVHIQRVENIRRLSDRLLGNTLGFAPRPVAAMHRLPPRDFTDKSDECFKRAQEQAARQHIVREMYLNGLKTFKENATSRDDHCPEEFLVKLKEDLKEMRRHFDLFVDVVKDQDRHKRESLKDRIRAIQSKTSSEAGLAVVEPAVKVAEPIADVAEPDMPVQASAARYGATLEELAELESEIGIETPAESEVNSSMGWRTDYEVEEDIVAEAKKNAEKTETVAKVAEQPTDRLEICVKELEKLLKEEREHFRDMATSYAAAETKAANAENHIKKLEKQLEELRKIHLEGWTKYEECFDESARLEDSLQQRVDAAEKRASDAEKKTRIAEKRVEELEELATDVESNFNARLDVGAEDCEDFADSWGVPNREERAFTHGDGIASNAWGPTPETAEHRLNDEPRNEDNVYPDQNYYNLAMAQQGATTAQARLAKAGNRARKGGEVCKGAWGNTSVTDPFGYPHGWAPQTVPARPASRLPGDLWW